MVMETPSSLLICASACVGFLGWHVMLIFGAGCRFLPSACADLTPVLLGGDGAVRDAANEKDLARSLDFGPWILARDRYALFMMSCESWCICVCGL